MYMVFGQKMARRQFSIFITFSDVFACPYVACIFLADYNQNLIFYEFLSCSKFHKKAKHTCTIWYYFCVCIGISKEVESPVRPVTPTRGTNKEVELSDTASPVKKTFIRTR